MLGAKGSQVQVLPFQHGKAPLGSRYLVAKPHIYNDRTDCERHTRPILPDPQSTNAAAPPECAGSGRFWSADSGTQELPDLLGGLCCLGRAERGLVDVGQAFADL
jgi:hypothetical protein